MEYVKMQPAHTAQVAALEAECFSTPWSEKSIEGELTNPLSVWLVAVEDGTVAGYVGSQSVPPESDMMNLAVAPGCRRKGIARQLVLSLIKNLKEVGIRSITLEVRRSNIPAIKLYTNLGFTQVGIRPNYYFDPKEDALILRKEWEA